MYTKEEKETAESVLNGKSKRYTFAHAYQIIFNQSLEKRLIELIAEYPNSEPNALNTELCKYRYSGTTKLIELLHSL